MSKSTRQARRRSNRLGLVPLLLLFISGLSFVFCQPRLIVKKSDTYRVGDRLDADLVLFDKDFNEKRLLELIKPGTRVAVLIVFGGGMESHPDEEEFRGPLWCEDSFDDLGVQRALVQAFKNQAVQFIPIAVPPVYHADSYGWDEDDFLGKPDESEVFQAAARSFIEKTEKEVRNGLLPYQAVFYDPKFRLAQNREERELNADFGRIYPWQGKLKWHQDGRKYGTPTLWFISGEGEVLAAPLFGNDYDGDPPEINYGYHDARKLIEGLLENPR